MEHVTYQELVNRYGQKMAYGLLLSIGAIGQDQEQSPYVDEETSITACT